MSQDRSGIVEVREGPWGFRWRVRDADGKIVLTAVHDYKTEDVARRAGESFAHAKGIELEDSDAT